MWLVSFSCLFLKRVQHIHTIGNARGVDDTVGARFIPDSDFLNTLANRRHRLEIIGLFTALHFVELITRILLRIFGKLAQAFE